MQTTIADQGGGSGITKSKLGFMKLYLLENGRPTIGMLHELWTAIRMEFFSTYYGNSAFCKRDWIVLYQFIKKQRRFDPSANRMAQTIRENFIDRFGHDLGSG